MSNDYFLRVTKQTENRMWVNNPTVEEAHKSIAAGAVACTTNPTFSARILRVEPDAAKKVLMDVVRQEPDDAAAAHKVQMELCARIMPPFMPIYEKTRGELGFVSVQGDPRLDHDADHVIHECLADRKRLGPNHIAKIPVTKAGLKAIEAMLRQDIPVIATEVFSIAQAIAASEVYERAAAASKKRPAYFLTHITGIYDEYLDGYVKKNGVNITPSALKQAGCIVARQQYRLFMARRYPGVMLGGGVRAPYHFTELLGSKMHVTLNYSTVEELNQLDPPIVPRMDTPSDVAVVDELRRKLPDFVKAFDPAGLRVEEFAEYGPVVHFANIFRTGWETLLAAVAAARKP